MKVGSVTDHAREFNVAIPSPLRSYTAGAARVTIEVTGEAPRLDDILAALDNAYPGIRFRMVDERGRVRPHIQIFVNGSVQREPAAAIPPGAEIMLVAALSGG